MRVVLSAVVLAILPVAAAANAQQVTLAGQVVAELDNRPLGNVRITLEQMADDGPPPVVLTDAFGRFTIAAAPAPSHRLIARKAGFATTRSVAVAGAEITLRLRLGAVITGRIVDEVGEPVVGALVAVEPRQPAATPAPTETDDRGEYRLPVDPGVPLIVVATTIGLAPNEVSVVNGAIRISAAPRFRTYYPAGASAADATPLTLNPGEEQGGVDFTIPIARSGRQPTTAAATLPFAPTVRVLGAPERADTFGTVAGRIVDAAGLPLANAQVVVVADRMGAARQMTRSDGGGRFAFARVQDGALRVVVSKPGYATNETRFDLDAGSRARDDIELRLPKWAVVSGRVLDDFGEPVQGAKVQLLRVRFEGGRRRLAQAGESGPATDDRGAFRLYGLDPGQYMVTAQPGEIGTSEMPGYVRSYYPGALSATEAQAVTVGQGGELLGVDIALVRSPTFAVRGRIVDSAGAPTTGGALNLWPAQGPGGVAGLPAGSRIGDDGSFEFPNVAPGQYVIQSYSGKSQPSVEGEFGVLRLNVTDANLTGLVLQTSRGSEVSGAIVFDDPGRLPPSRAGVEIAAVPADLDISPANWALAGPGPDWRFSLAGISGPRRIQATRLPDGWAVKAIRANGIDVTDRPLTFETAADSIVDVEVVLTAQVSELTGRLVDERGRGIAATPLVVFSFARDRWYAYSRFVRRVTTREDGSFSVRGLPADSYYAAEIPADAELEGAWQDPSLLESLAAAGTLVVIGEAQPAAVILRR